MKKCRICNKEKELQFFQIRSDNNKYRNECLDCKSKYNKNYVTKCIEKQSDYTTNNTKRIQEYRSKLSQDRVEEINKQSLELYYKKQELKAQKFFEENGITIQEYKYTNKLEKFICISENCHGSKYDYSYITYVNNTTKVKILCKACGELFWQTPKDHKNGRGCHNCAPSGFNVNLPATLYVLQENELFKIGITNRKVSERCREISNSYGKKFKIIYTSESDGHSIIELESTLLKFLRSKYEQPPEKFSGSTECFYNINVTELINLIKEYYGTRPHSKRR